MNIQKYYNVDKKKNSFSSRNFKKCFLFSPPPEIEKLWEDDIEFHPFNQLEVQAPKSIQGLDKDTRLVVEEIKTWKKVPY